MSNKNLVALDRSARSKCKLNSQTVTTSRCTSVQPVKCEEVVPTDNFTVDMQQYNRVDALTVSAFASFKNTNAAFYVKNSQVWKPYDSFKTGAPYAFGYQNVVPTKKPYLSSFDLLNIFSNSSLSLCTYHNISSQVQGVDDCQRLLDEHEYDFIIYHIHNDNDSYGYKFTEVGVAFYKVLFQLGYRFPVLLDDTKPIDVYIQLEQSLLPLMSYLSILVNYYVPLKWRSYQFVNSMSYLVDPVPQHFQSTSDVFSNDMSNFVASIRDLIRYVYYGDDYYTSSLVEPFAVPTGQNTNYQKDPYRSDLAVDTDRNTSYAKEPSVVQDDAQNLSTMTQYIAYALSVVTGQAQISAMTLNDVKAAALAKFGYTPECADMVPYLLDKEDSSINVIPEISTADTLQGSGDNQTGAPIGYKAGSGQGLGYLKGKYHFSHYGTFIVVNSIMPDYFYFSGIRRQLLRVTQDEEFDKNFVKLGYQAIAKAELDINNNNPMNVFGFVRKYADYAKGNDILGGDFIINTRNNGLDCFHLGRYLRPDASNNELFSVADANNHGGRLVVTGDGTQFSRLFVEGTTDPIQQWFIWKIDASRPIDSEISIGEHVGEVVETKPVGATLNG